MIKHNRLRKAAFASTGTTVSSTTSDTSSSSSSASSSSRDDSNSQVRNELPPPASAMQIRTKLLHSLGCVPHDVGLPPRASTTHRSGHSILSYEESLKADSGQTTTIYNDDIDDDKNDPFATGKALLQSLLPGVTFCRSQRVDQDDVDASNITTTTEASKRHSAPSNKNHTKNRRRCSNSSRNVVRFASTVTVRPIPSHAVYSNRVRAHLWHDPADLQAMTARNVAEFASEGWKHQNVLEEDDMVLCNDGELVHPVHFLIQEQQQRAALLQQQQQQRDSMFSARSHFANALAAQQLQL